jgi:hypothetical protein
MQQSISRRRVLTLGGAGLAGATGGLMVNQPAAAREEKTIMLAEERSYRPLSISRRGTVRIANTDTLAPGLARIEAVLARRAIFQDRACCGPS